MPLCPGCAVVSGGVDRLLSFVMRISWPYLNIGALYPHLPCWIISWQSMIYLHILERDMLGDRVIFPQQDSRTAAEMCRVPVVYGRPPSMPPFGTSPSPLSWIDTTVHIHARVTEYPAHSHGNPGLRRVIGMTKHHIKRITLVCCTPLGRDLTSHPVIIRCYYLAGIRRGGGGCHLQRRRDCR